MVYLSTDEVIIRKNFYDELIKYKKICDSQDNKNYDKLKVSSVDLSQELHSLLLKHNSKVFLLANNIIVMYRDYYDNLKQNITKNDSLWKNRYEELNKKYIQTHDEVIYLRRDCDKQYSQIALLRQKNIELEQKNTELEKKYIADIDILKKIFFQ